MNEMIERVARVLCSCAEEPYDDVSAPKYAADAHAAISAMREPTRGMLEACLKLDDDHTDTDHIWQAMIDAALKDKC